MYFRYSNTEIEFFKLIYNIKGAFVFIELDKNDNKM